MDDFNKKNITENDEKGYLIYFPFFEGLGFGYYTTIKIINVENVNEGNAENSIHGQIIIRVLSSQEFINDICINSRISTLLLDFILLL